MKKYNEGPNPSKISFQTVIQFALPAVILLLTLVSSAHAIREADTWIMIRDAQTREGTFNAPPKSFTINGTLDCFKIQAEDTISTSYKSNCTLVIRDASGETYGLKSGEKTVEDVMRLYQAGTRNVTLTGTQVAGGRIKLTEITTR